MPELAEVEYVARQMQQELPGNMVIGASVVVNKIIIHPDVQQWVHRVCGQHIQTIGRRGKYLLIHLESGETLVIHRRMTGNILLLTPGMPDERYLCAALDLNDGRRLQYTDPRKFGHIGLYTSEELFMLFTHLGPEPLSDDFTPALLSAICQTSSRTIKAVLLDQHCIAGIGNIYADESLFDAQIHPLRPAKFLSEEEIRRLHGSIQHVLQAGIQHGGTTFGWHRDLYGQAGTNVDHLQVYQQTGRLCHRCGSVIQRIVVEQRGTHVCPQCQHH